MEENLVFLPFQLFYAGKIFKISQMAILYNHNSKYRVMFGKSYSVSSATYIFIIYDLKIDKVIESRISEDYGSLIDMYLNALEHYA